MLAYKQERLEDLSDFCCREFVKEQKADRILFRNTFGTQPQGGAATNAFNLRLKNPANTNVVEWGNRLLALWEVRLSTALRRFS
jgi:all-trans-8'-apo-beta-carotenal 15,15'-oxygenase